MGLFGDQLYPTPPAVAKIMLEGIDFKKVGRVVDFQAGRGDLLEAVEKAGIFEIEGHRVNRRFQLFAGEIDPGLQAVLRDKGYPVISTDFLDYPGHQFFDLIVGNPPFRTGAAHLLHAWEISHGAEIRYLLNSETIRNPYTKERKRLMMIIEEYGKVIELGKVFDGIHGAEVVANVEVSLVILRDTRKDDRDFRIEFDPDEAEIDFSLDEITSRELAPANALAGLESVFGATVLAFQDLMRAKQRVDFYGRILRNGSGLSTDPVKKAFEQYHTEPEKVYEVFYTTLLEQAWKMVFEKTALAGSATQHVREEITKRQNGQITMAFTANNMRDLLMELLDNQEQIMIDCVLEAFDLMTQYYDGNREGLPGYKTNTAYAVKARFILDYIGGGYSGIQYHSQQKLDDIERALCHMNGLKFEEIKTIYQTYLHKPQYGEKVITTFFETKMYKKGTMHFRWLDEDLRKRFNGLVAKERWGELPEKVKTGVYK